MPTFVSAQYRLNDLPPPEQHIRAVDDEGGVWWLDDNCTQGDWLRYIEGGGTIEPADNAVLTPVDQQLLDAPDTLFGGPSIRQAFDVHGTGD